MARKAREISKTGIYHLVIRGINRQTIFEEDADKEKFLEVLTKYKHISHYTVYGYCLMDNHVHLLIKERNEPISLFFKRISSSYVYWYNQKYERCGHLFQERFHSEMVENRRYFLTVLRYIHQNPVKALLTTSIYESKWTSIHEYLTTSTLVDTHAVLLLFNKNKAEALLHFNRYMQQQNSDECLDINEKVRLTDSEIRLHMQQLGIPSSSYLQQLKRPERNAILIQLKGVKGVSIRQLSRVTGISKSVIDRVGDRGGDRGTGSSSHID